MAMKRFAGLVIAFIICIAFTQVTDAAIVSGTVISADDDLPIAGATVMLRGTDNKIKKYASTSTEGLFSIEAAATQGCTVEVSMIGYAKQSVKLDSATMPLKIIMPLQALKLKEVAVKAQRIRENGDTITYDVTSFSRKQDRNIGDVLNRMPGIDVDDKGKIKYQGEDINKFYIEGNDLLGGKYGVATKGIDHNDVGAVEVLENHQPMQVLRGLSFSDRAAINLKLKNRAKATLVAHGEGGAGLSANPHGALWQGELFAMMMSGGYQMLTTLKTNNTGNSLGGMLSGFLTDDTGEPMSGYVQLGTPATPGLRKSRTQMNRSWLFSSSHLWKNRRGGEFRVQMDYSNDRISSESSTITTYYRPDGDKIISEKKHALSHTNALTGLFSYEVNEKSYFLNNILSLNINWDDMNLNTSGTISNNQQTRTPLYDISDNIKIIKRFGGRHLITFSGINQWKSLPERLTIEHNGKSYGQHVSQHAFFTDERVSYGLICNRVIISLEGGLSGYLRKLHTDLWGMDNVETSTTNNLTTDYIRVFISPKFEWNSRKIEMSLKVPLNLYTYFFSAGMRNRTELFASPALSARWKITPRMELNLSGSARRSPASLHNIHNGITLGDYRTLNAGTDDYYTSSGQSVSLSYRYRHTAHGLFLSALANHAWNRSETGSVQNFMGDYIIYSYSYGPSRSQSTNFMGTVSKTLDFIRGTASMGAQYMISGSTMISDNLPVDCRSRLLSISPRIDGSISSWLNWSYGFNFTRNGLSMSGSPTLFTDSYCHRFSLTLTPADKIRIGTSGEYYRNEIEAHRYKNMVMLDADITYNITPKLDITASVSNILDHRSYSYTTFGTLSAMERSSMLRGREFLISIHIKK